MIERYFRAGVRFLWNKPNDNNGLVDGSIVNSTGAAPNLIYDGLDGHRAAVDPTLLTINAGTVLGINKGAGIAAGWLDYAPGRTAFTPAAADTLSGYMTGCLIIRGTYNGALSLFHVGTVNNPEQDKMIKGAFAQSLPQDATGFNALDAWPTGEIALIQGRLGNVAAGNIFALVTAGGQFYSILMFNVADGAQGQYANPMGLRYWVVGGIKAVPSQTRVSLLAHLMSPSKPQPI